MLARNFSCWLETFHAGSKLFMLARKLARWLENERASITSVHFQASALIFEPAFEFCTIHIS
jgi:hypothetical protein